MKEQIKQHINNPEMLEELYHGNKRAFEAGFEEIYPEIEKSVLSEYWRVRLNYTKITERIKKVNLPDILILISSCLITGFLIKIPQIFDIRTEEIFYMKNAGIIVFAGLTLYTLWADKGFGIKRLLTVSGIFILLAVYVNLLPSVLDRDSVNLAFIHLPFLLWFIFGMVFIDFSMNDKSRRMDYIRYNGDLAILMALIMIAGGILTAITIGLFDTIGFNIENFYIENIGIVGAVSVPIVATFVLRNYPMLTSKIAPVIANIFSPLVLLTAIGFLVALAVSGKSPYNDRDFLLIFNVMLLGVMAVVVFSISEASATRKQKFSEMVLFVLSIITVIIDLIALSAIFYRLGSYGITPNRLAVLGSNILILGNLVLLVLDLFKVNFKNGLIREVELTIAKYLPVYLAWILFVVFGFPLIFGMN